jgi:DNA-binding SARP family transcriptional activator
MWHLRTLGQLSLHPEGPESEPVLRNAKALGVLGYLAGIPGHTARRSHLAELFWPGADTRRGRRSLRQALYYLSKKADAELVRSDAEELALVSERLDVDLWDFDAALEEGRYETAVELYGGPFLEGFQRKAGRELEGWIEAENERIWGGLKTAYHALVTGARQEGRPERAARHARGYVQLNPLDERAQVALIGSLLEAGDQVAAYRAYERYRTLLREELGAEPGEELDAKLRELRTELFGGDDAWGGSRARASGPASPGPESPGPGDVSGPERPGTADRRLWVAAGATALVFAAAALAASWLGVADEGPRTAWERVDADLLARRESDTEASWHVAIREGVVRVDRSELGWFELGDPTGRRVAAIRRSSTGPDVVMREREGPTIPVTTTRRDEHPVAWAPDGSYLVFKRGFLQEDAPGLRYVAYLCSVETGEVRRLADLELTGQGPVAWSPTGTHLALAAVGPDGGSDIHHLEADGRGLTRLTIDDARDEEPAWSPGGERLAFVSWRTGRPHVWVVNADGSNLEQVTFGSARARSPAWVSDHHLVFLSDRDGAWDLWSLDLVSRRTRRLTDLGDFRPGHLLRWHRSPPDRLVERVAIRPRPRAVSPGQHLRLEARGLMRDGTEIPAARRVLR